MTPKQALETLEGVEHHMSLGEAGDVLLATIRRDWAVRVLDAAADAFEWPPLAPVKQLDGTFAIALIHEVNGLAEPFDAYHVHPVQCNPAPGVLSHRRLPDARLHHPTEVELNRPDPLARGAPRAYS